MFNKLLTILFVSGSFLFGLGFGSMGNTSAGLGNSGVALRKSAWGIYYNPALLASDNRGKFGLSFGAAINEKGLDNFLSAFLNQETFDPSKLPLQTNNALELHSQNGIVIQITGGTLKIPKIQKNQQLALKIQDNKASPETIEVRSPYGAFTMAAFLSLHALGDIHNKNNTNQSSIQVDSKLSGIALIEAPVGWGWRFELDSGEISIGAAIKYMGLTSIDSMLQTNFNSNQASTTVHYPKDFAISHWFGIDLGLLYSFEGFHTGFVIKNINTPSFDIKQQNFTIDPQFRLGISYEFAQYFALTFDADLAPNHILSEGSPKTQTIGGGFLMDFKYFDLRLGVMGDIANKFDQGAIITGGINLLGFDLAIQASSKMFDMRGYKIPRYISAKLGGSFTF